MINKRLKAARLRANITQEKLGIAAGIDEKSARARVSQYENGTHQPTFETMCAFSKVLKGRVIFLNTKNGDQRIVPISDKLEKEIRGKKKMGKLFNVDYINFCKILHVVKPDLPKGQATHVLRHTFASHFMMNGGNIIALQQILGHASIIQTMVYAHLAPDYLQHAITLNPLKGGIEVE
ncbi:integrase [Photorhabdus luminescens]|nr:integrase [Photorhabdus luminescens]